MRLDGKEVLWAEKTRTVRAVGRQQDLFPQVFVSVFSGLFDLKLPQPASSGKNCLGLRPGYLPYPSSLKRDSRRQEGTEAKGGVSHQLLEFRHPGEREAKAAANRQRPAFHRREETAAKAKVSRQRREIYLHCN